jgi:hypothetical protein
MLLELTIDILLLLNNARSWNLQLLDLTMRV